MERARTRELTRRGVSVAAVAICLAGACRVPGPSFGALLAKIDADPAGTSRPAFLNAAALATGTEERLRLLKRAAGRDPGLYADSAKAVVAGGAVSEPVALAALDAFLSDYRYGDALALFDGPLDPVAMPAEYAETLVLAIRNGVGPSCIPVTRLVACADALGEGAFLEYAAVDAMVAGDRSTARALIVDSVTFEARGRRNLPYRLLWDASALDTLCDRVPDPSDPLAIAVDADAEYLRGNIASACAGYADLIERFPSWSWKPYAALARFEAREPEAAGSPLQWPHAPLADSFPALSSPAAMAERLYAAIAERFPDSAEAAIERARWLASKGLPEQAAELAAGLPGEAAAILGLRYGAPGRAVPDASRLAAEYPDSPAVVDESLAALARRGAWGRFSEIAARSAAAGLATERAWFWRVVAATLSGDLSAAADAIRKYGIESAGYPGAFNLGILELAASRPAEAADAFALAANLAGGQAERADAYVMAGDAMRASGRDDEAESAYEAAMSAFPASRDARSRLERMSLDD